jgi:hypothetical protein
MRYERPRLVMRACVRVTLCSVELCEVRYLRAIPALVRFPDLPGPCENVHKRPPLTRLSLPTSSR